MAQIRLDQDDAKRDLPAVCMVCGEPATIFVRKKFRWHPSWVYLLILVHLLIYAIVAMAVTNQALVQVPLCHRHRRHWLHRNLLIWGSMIGLVMAGIVAFMFALEVPRQHQGGALAFVVVSCALLSLVWIVVTLIVQNTTIRAREITDSELLLAGVCEEFIEADLDRQARRRRRQRVLEEFDGDAEDDERFGPRRRAGPSDAIEEV